MTRADVKLGLDHDADVEGCEPRRRDARTIGSERKRHGVQLVAVAADAHLVKRC